MILDYLKNSHFYSPVNARIHEAFQFLKNTNFKEKDLGRYDIDGNNLYAIVNEYQTKQMSEGKLEAHRKYLDIHYILAGSEHIATTFLTDQIPIRQYDDQEDYLLFSCPYSTQLLIPGMFALLYPQDIHMPGVHLVEKTFVRKVVVKALI